MGDAESDREAMLGRLAHREGLVLEKSRVLHPHRTDRGGYRLVDPYLNETVVGARFEYDLDAIEAYLRMGRD